MPAKRKSGSVRNSGDQGRQSPPSSRNDRLRTSAPTIQPEQFTYPPEPPPNQGQQKRQTNDEDEEEDEPSISQRQEDKENEPSTSRRQEDKENEPSRRRRREDDEDEDGEPSARRRRIDSEVDGRGDLQKAVDAVTGRAQRSASPERKRTKKVPENSWVKMGRVLGRMFVPLQDFKKFFDRILAVDPDGHVTSNQRAELEIYEAMVAKFPDLVYMVEEMPEKKMSEVCGELNKGRAKARAEDYIDIKRDIGLMYPFKTIMPADTPEGKKLRGFNHDECAKLLSPENLDLSDPEIREGLRNGTIAVVPGDYSCMLYRNYVIGAVNKIDGLFLSQILFMAGRYVTRGRSAGLSNTSRVCVGKLAVKSQVDTITPELIAYVSMLVHCALSDNATLAPNAVGIFTYKDYFESIATILRRFPLAFRKTLIAEWTLEVFGNATASVVDALEGKENGTLSFPPGCLGSRIYEQAGNL